MASAALPGRRGGGGLQSPARDHEAELWRAQVVVHLPDRAPRRRSAATGSEALPPIRQQVFWESRSLRIDLRVVPGERKIRPQRRTNRLTRFPATDCYASSKICNSWFI